MLATDPLSLVFLGCFLFSGLMLVVTTLLGAAQGHAGLGAHAAHSLHFPHPAGHTAGHVGAHAPGHGAHAGHAGASDHAGSANAHAAVGTETPPAFLADLRSLVLGALNLYSILALLLFFGLLGYLLLNFSPVGAAVAVVLALIFGVVAALLVSSLMARLFLMGEASALTADSSQLEGRLGQISMPIRAGGTGEVVYANLSGARTSVGARSADGEAVSAGSEVVILRYEQGIAYVQPWDRFMSEVRAGQAPALEPIE